MENQHGSLATKDNHYKFTQHWLSVTGTFKHTKLTLKQEGFDIAQTSDPLYVLLPDEQHSLLSTIFSVCIGVGSEKGMQCFFFSINKVL